jgi:Putative transposase
MENLLNKLGRTKWNVHIRERYPHGQGILVYLARYLRGGPLSNRRLRACDGERVVFGYEERAKGLGGHAQRRTMSLPLEQFIGRWRLYVPPSRAVLVRCWGLYAHTQGEALALCRQQLGQAPVPGPEPVALRPPIPPEVDASCERCPVCGQPLVCTALIRRATARREGVRAGGMSERTGVGGGRPPQGGHVWSAAGRSGDLGPPRWLHARLGPCARECRPSQSMPGRPTRVR